MKSANEPKSARKIVSFDVFDTAILRLVGTPHSVFTLLGFVLRQRGVVSEEPHAFRARRVQAQIEIGSRLQRQVTLDEIYEQFQKLSDWSALTRDIVKHAEIEWEKKLIRPLPRVALKIAEERKKNGSVVFASDMYLPEEVVKDILHQCRVLSAADHCFVSSRSLKTKSGGALFSFISTELGASPKQFVHHGDNVESDITSARRMGLEAVLVADAKMTRFEEILETHSESTMGLTSLFAGVSRKVRLDEKTRSMSPETTKIAAGVAGPLLVSYVEWCLRRAHEASLEKLFFASRDGQLLLEIARLLKPLSPYKGELEYLYGGRQAWVLPAISDEKTYSALADLFDGFLDETFLDLCGIPRELYPPIPPEISDEKRARRVSQILSDPSIQARVFEFTRRQRELLVDCLKQSGVTSDAKWGFVETGWSGNLQKGLHSVLRTAGLALPMGYYLGLADRERTETDLYRETYLYDGLTSQAHLDLGRFLSAPIEIFCAADHAQVSGFAREAGTGKVTASFAYKGPPPNHAWSREFAGVVVDFARQFGDLRELFALFAKTDPRDCLAELLTAFWREPTRAEATALSGTLFENGVSGTKQLRLVGKYTIVEWLQSLRKGAWIKRDVSFWPEGALALSPKLFSRSMKARHVLKKLLFRR